MKPAPSAVVIRTVDVDRRHAYFRHWTLARFSLGEIHVDARATLCYVNAAKELTLHALCRTAYCAIRASDR